jgi:putrescine transport system substrate-binding protein
MWFDQMAIPVDAPNPEGAHAFLNFIMEPENMAAASNYVYYANGNEASKPFLNRGRDRRPGDLPDEATSPNLYTTDPIRARAAVVTRMWTKVKSGTCPTHRPGDTLGAGFFPDDGAPVATA